MNGLVKIIKDNDGDFTLNDSWHLIDPCAENGQATFCTGEYFGAGESFVEYEEKTAPRGGITCKRCIDKLKTYKAVKL